MGTGAQQLSLVTGRVETEACNEDGAANHRLDSSECLAHTHAPGPTVPAPSEVSPQIEVVLAAQFIPRSAADVGQEVIGSKDLTLTGEHFADAPESGKAELLR